MNPDSEFISLQKDEYVINILAMGIAVQMLAANSPMSIVDWTHYLTQEATIEYEQLSSQQIEQMIAIYDDVRNSQPPEESIRSR
jgi:redox-regulated HSP33 family molecular chaperone